MIYLIDDIRLFLSISCSLLFTTNLIKKSMNVEEQQVFIIKWLLSQSDLFLNRVKGRVTFLWRCKPSPFEPYWLSTWVVHWIHRDRRKTCTHTANFLYTPQHFISSINVTEQSSLEVPIKTCILHIKNGVINHSAVTYADQMLLFFSSGSCLIATSVLLLKWEFHLFIQMWTFLQAHFDVWNGA